MNQEVKFCQSCAMPLSQAGVLGSNSDGSPSEDYCRYCYVDGKFTAEISMSEMIDFCAGPMAEANPGMTTEEAKAKMTAFFPTLKRWSQL